MRRGFKDTRFPEIQLNKNKLSEIFPFNFKCCILKTLLCVCPLQPVRVLPMYWTVKPGLEAGHHWSNFPCFIDTRGEDEQGFHYYGLPCLEYPGLFKVSQSLLLKDYVT